MIHPSSHQVIRFSWGTLVYKFLLLNNNQVVGVFLSVEEQTPSALRVPDDFDEASVMLHGVVDGVFLPRPFEWSSWNGTAWVDDLTALRGPLLRMVKLERDRQLVRPITVMGAVFDGDTTAQDNLKAKLEEVRLRMETSSPLPPTELLWLDYQNQPHFFADMTSYYEFLSRYAIALSSRGTAIYMNSWAHKAAIEAETDPETLFTYDVTTGWPP